MQAKYDYFPGQVEQNINSSKAQMLCVNSHRTQPCWWEATWVCGRFHLSGQHHQHGQQGVKRHQSKAGKGSGCLLPTLLNQRCSYATAISNLFCCTVLKAGEWSKQTRGEWKCSTTDASDEYTTSSGPIPSLTIYTNKQGAGALIKRLYTDAWDGSGIYWMEDGAGPHP